MSVTVDGLPDAVAAGNTIHWRPSFDLATRLQPRRTLQAVAIAIDSLGNRANRVFEIAVRDVNRPPVVQTNPAGFVRAGELLTPPIEDVVDPDADAVRFSAQPADLPMGAALSPEGVLTWRPSHTQVAALPIQIPFRVTDGQAPVDATIFLRRDEADRPPRIRVLSLRPEIPEGEELVVSFSVQDPNTNIGLQVDADPRLGSNMDVEYDPASGAGEVRWTPPHDIVASGSPPRAMTFELVALDASNLESRQRVQFHVVDRIDPDALFLSYQTPTMKAARFLQAADSAERRIQARVDGIRTSQSIRTGAKISLGVIATVFPTFQIGDGRTPGMVAAISAGIAGLIEALEAANLFKSPGNLEKGLETIRVQRALVRPAAETFASNYAVPLRRYQGGFEAASAALERQVNEAAETTDLSISGTIDDAEIRRVIAGYSGLRR